MTLIATGRGAPQIRIAIEGLPWEFVTSRAMERDVSTTTAGRYAGLVREGLVVTEDVNPIKAEVEARGMTATIVDRRSDNLVTRLMSDLPRAVAYLTSDATTTDTVLDVDSTSSIAVDSEIHVGTEAMMVDFVNPGADQITVQRAIYGTTAQAHFAAGENQRRQALFRGSPPLQGRRVSLYLYERGEDLTGDGTLRWRGIVSEPPRLGSDASAWSVQLDPITSLLQAELGRDLGSDPTVRGIHYPSPFFCAISIRERDEAGGAAGWDRSTEAEDALGGNASTPIRLAGFWEDQEEWCDAVTTEIARAFGAMTTAFDHAPPRAVSLGPDSWTIEAIKVTGRSLHIRVRGGKTGALIDWLGEERVVQDVVVEDGTTANVDAISAGTAYQLPTNHPDAPAGVGTVPRGLFGFLGGDPLEPTRGVLPIIDLTESNRLYLASAPGSVDSFVIEWSDGESDDEVAYTIATIDSGSNFVEVESSSSGGLEAFSHTYTAFTLPEISLARNAAGKTPATLGDVILRILGDSPDVANLGLLPLITTDDVDATPFFNAAFFASASAPWLRRRKYVYAKPLRMDEWLAQELRMHGLVPKTTSDGKISATALRIPAASERVEATIGTSKTVVKSTDGNVGHPEVLLDAFGYLTTVELKTGYDEREEEHTGPQISVTNLRALSERRNARVVTWEPKSISAAGDRDVTAESVQLVAERTLGFFGFPYIVVDVPVPFSLYELEVGDLVQVDLPNAPDMEGGRGFSGIGQVIGRRWPLDRASGRLKVILHRLPVAGWAPSAYMNGTATVVSGTQYDVPVSLTDDGGVSLAPTGYSMSDLFAPGYRVQTMQRDSASPIDVVGTVDTVSASTLRITFDSGIGAIATDSDVYIGFAPPSDSALDVAQRAWFYIAANSGFIQYDSDPERARQFAP